MEFTVFVMEIPEGFKGVKDARLESGDIVVTPRQRYFVGRWNLGQSLAVGADGSQIARLPRRPERAVPFPR
jgi:hypothetical protein